MSSCQLLSQTVSNHVEVITINSGLSSNTVKDIIQDDAGMIWFATANGLNRYDGMNIKKFHTTDSPNSLSDNNINCLLKDSDGFIWSGTMSGGVCRYDNEFMRFQNDPTDSTSLSNDQVWCFYEDSKQNIWVGTQEGLNLYDKESNSFVRYNNITNSAEGPITVSSLMQDSRGNLWIGTWDSGIYCMYDFDQETKEAKFIHLPRIINGEYGNNSVISMLEDNKGYLWLGLANDGLYEMITPAKSIISEKSINDIKFRKVDLNLENVQILDIRQLKNGQIVLGTYFGMIYAENLEDPKRFKQNIFQLESNTPKGTLNKRVTRILEDNAGVIWIATIKGVFKDYSNNLTFTTSELESLENYSILSGFARDRTNEIYLGTNKGVIYQLPIDGQKEKPILQLTDDNHISAITIDNNDNLWCGTWRGNIYRMSLKKGNKLKKHEVSKLGKSIVGGDNIWSILQNKDHRMWIASHIGLYLFDPTTESCFKYEGKEKIIEGNIFDIVLDQYGNYWVAAAGKGLYKLSWESDQLIIQLFSSNDTKPSLKNNIIFDLLINEDKLWIASSSGLQQFNVKTESFIADEKLDNAINGDIFALGVLNDDQIICTSNDGLVLYNEEKQNFHSYTNNDGLVDNFEFRSSFKNSTGAYFGGINGFNYISEDAFNLNGKAMDIRISDVKLNNESVIPRVKDPTTNNIILTSNINKAEKLNLSYKHSLISFDFSVLDFVDPYQYVYNYRLEGYDEDWVNSENKTSATYMNLPAGSYNFQVRAKSKSGQWSPIKNLAINISPAYWTTNWFKLLSLLFAMGAIYLIIKLRERRAKRKEFELQEIIEEKTLALKGNIFKLEENEKSLTQMNTRLKEYVESNEQLKQFAYIASHDLKAPLRTIISFGDLLARKPLIVESVKEKEYLNFMRTGANNLNSLIISLLEFSKIDGAQIVFEEVNVLELINMIMIELDSIIKERNAIIHVSDQFPISVIADKIKLRQIFQNLITNGLKFVPPERIPELKMSCSETEGFWNFEIHDNGIGIDDNHKETVFNMFERLVTQKDYEGTGIGLSVCQKLVMKHKGTICISDNSPCGSVFSFTISKELTPSIKLSDILPEASLN